MAFMGSSVHIPCALSLIEILAVLYRSHLRTDLTPANPHRDYLVLSKGHGVMAQYACLYEMGRLAKSDIDHYLKDGTRLKGLCDAHIDGVGVTSGSLGHGLSVGVGLALAAKRNSTGQQCYCIIGDGESNEGSIWEALLFASHFHLDNLTVIVDQNGFQALGRTSDIIDLGDVASKLRAFGLYALEVDGHDERALDHAFHLLKRSLHSGPRALVARTIKGRGISFMENNNSWHYTRLNEDTYRAALKEMGANT